MVAAALADSTTRDALPVLLNGMIALADSLRVSGHLQLTNPPAPVPGWFERWGMATLANALALAVLGAVIKGWLARGQHELDKRLEDYKLGPAAVLALLTHRAGVLSQVQLEATRAMWAKVVDLHLQVRELASVLRSLESVLGGDLEVAERLNADNIALAIALEKERAFLPHDVYELAADYFAGVRGALEIVAERTQARDAPHPDPANARAEFQGLRQQLTEQSQRIEGLYEQLAARIGDLTSPRLPDSASTSPQA